MHFQLVNPEPEPMPDATPTAAPEPEASVVQPQTRAEWRKVVAARCTERNITVAHACREMGLLNNFFSPSNLAVGVTANVVHKMQAWLNGETPVIEPSAASRRQVKDAPDDAPVITKVPPAGGYTWTVTANPAPTRPAPARSVRRYPAITVEPSAMPLDDLVEYLERLRDLMPGATVTWSTAITVGVE